MDDVTWDIIWLVLGLSMTIAGFMILIWTLDEIPTWVLKLMMSLYLIFFGAVIIAGVGTKNRRNECERNEVHLSG